MDRELVSVLMVNYNRGTTIGESIKSVLAQTYTDLELIIVDDGSTDDSCSVIESIKDSRIKLYRLEQNEHISHATKYGFQKVLCGLPVHEPSGDCAEQGPVYPLRLPR